MANASTHKTSFEVWWGRLGRCQTDQADLLVLGLCCSAIWSRIHPRPRTVTIQVPEPDRQPSMTIAAHLAGSQPFDRCMPASSKLPVNFCALTCTHLLILPACGCRERLVPRCACSGTCLAGLELHRGGPGLGWGQQSVLSTYMGEMSWTAPPVG